MKHARNARTRSAALVCILAASITLAGCTSPRLLEPTAGNAALFSQFAIYDAHTGRPMTLPQLARRAARADVVFFGEHHNDAVCNQVEAQLLAAIAQTGRRTALAMEFFETDTQSAIDDYFAGRIGETEFRERSRQGRRYATSHRPLIEICRAANIPVIAANTPRPLLRAYSRSGAWYPDFLETRSDDERRWLPPTSDVILGRYYERFVDVMSVGHGGAAPPAATQPASAPSTQPESAPASAPATDAALPAETQPTAAPGEETPSASAPGTAPAPIESVPAAAEPEHAAPTSAPAAADEVPASAPSADSADAPPASAPAPATQPAESPAPASAPSPPPVPEGDVVPMLRGFRVQLLWDDTMSEWISRARQRDPRRLVMLVVGVFHVEHEGGTALKYRIRRPQDERFTIVYRSRTESPLGFDADDASAGDVIIYGITDLPERE